MDSTNVIDKIINFFVENQDPRTKTWFLSGSIAPLCTILATYLYFCVSAGPKFMKNRKPFSLKYTLVAYNALQVVLSAIIVYEGLVSGWMDTYSYRCEPVDYSENPQAMRMARGVWFYYMCKITELVDTIFFVLRKKQRQVSGLHLYHHTLMPVCALIGVKYFPGGHGTLLGPINGFIHVLMYAYYLLSALGQEMQKYLWWKRHLTTLQIVQFLIIFFHTLQVQFQPSCVYPKSIAFLLTLNAAIFFYMFSSFYYHNYVRVAVKSVDASRKKTDDDVVADKKSDLPITNGHVADGNGHVGNGSAKNFELFTESRINRIKSSWYEEPVPENNGLNQRFTSSQNSTKSKLVKI